MVSDAGVFGRRAALGGAVAAALSTRRARAQAPVTVRAMTLQGAPLQMQAYARMVAEFEQAHPGIKVLVEPIAETVLWPKLAAAYAGGDVPDLVLQATAPPVVSLQNAGLLLPMDDVVKAVGEDDFEPNTRNLYRGPDGHYFAACASNNCVSLLWYRKDLLAEAGLAVPETWDDLLNVARTLTKGGKYGTALPYGKTAMTNSILWTLVYQAGGRVIADDGSVVFASEPVEAALEFLREMRQFCPPGANRYDFGDVLNAYVSGASATTMYTGRAIVNTIGQNPAIADQIDCAPYPYRKGGVPWRSGAFESLIIPKGAQHVDEAKLFAAWNFRPATYIAFLNATPGHQIPTLKSVLASSDYRNDPVLTKYKHQLDVTVDTLARAHSTAKPFDDSKLIVKAGDIQGSGVFADVVQRVVVEKQSPKAAASWGQDQIARIMRG